MTPEIRSATVSEGLRAIARTALETVPDIAERFIANTLSRPVDALSRIQAPRERLEAVAYARIQELLEHLAGGDRDGYVRLVIGRFRAGDTSGQQELGKLGISLSDFVQTLAAQKLALIQWLETQPLDPSALIALVTEIEHLYIDITSGYAVTYAALQAEYLRLSTENSNILELNTELAHKAEELSRSNDELKLIADVSRALTITGTLDDVLAEGLGTLCSLIGVKLGAVWLWDDALDGLQIRAGYQLDDAARAIANARYPGKREGSPVLTSYFARETVAISDARSYEGFAPLPGTSEELGFRATIYLPLVYQGDAWGVLSLYWEDVRTFPENERQLLRSFSDQMAVAIRVAALLEDRDRARKTLEVQVQERTRELSQQKHFAENILDHAPAAISVLDRDMITRQVNAEYCRIVRRSADQLLNRSFLDAFVGDEQVGRIFRHVLETGEPWSAQGFPLMLKQPEADVMTFWDFTYVPMKKAGDGVDGILFLGIEVSERVERERLQKEQIEHLRQVDALKDQFLSILSHELRTPVNAIMGFGSILADEVVAPLSDVQREYLAKMLRGADLLLNLINDLLDMSRIQAGKFALEPRPMAFPPVAADVAAHLAALAELRGHVLEVEVPHDLPPLVADEQRVTQILTNLATNAIKFTPEGGRIRIRACSDGDQLRCEVSDDGVGIATEHLPKLFQPFTQIDMSSTRRVGGTGLGLSIAKALVEAHGGRIGVDSAPGEGSTFWFTLPLDR